MHVNIVGDATGSYDIPTWTESYSGYNGEGDQPYTTLEGGDVYPDKGGRRPSHAVFLQLPATVLFPDDGRDGSDRVA